MSLFVIFFFPTHEQSCQNCWNWILKIRERISISFSFSNHFYFHYLLWKPIVLTLHLTLETFLKKKKKFTKETWCVTGRKLIFIKVDKEFLRMQNMHQLTIYTAIHMLVINDTVEYFLVPLTINPNGSVCYLYQVSATFHPSLTQYIHRSIILNLKFACYTLTNHFKCIIFLF